jgi:hypothetical protein
MLETIYQSFACFEHKKKKNKKSSWGVKLSFGPINTTRIFKLSEIGMKKLK